MDKAILFDMDGLMVDSQSTWIAAEKTFLKNLGKEYTVEIGKKYHGLRVAGMIEVMIREYNLPISQKEGEQKLVDYAQATFDNPLMSLLPGCAELVKSLSVSRKYKKAIASSSPKRLIETMVKRFHFEQDFDELVSGEDVKNGKPAPDIFLRSAELLGVKPGSCIVLEDAPNGIKAAKAAGMKAVAVYNKQYYKADKFKEADLIIESLTQLNIQIIDTLLQ